MADAGFGNFRFRGVKLRDGALEPEPQYEVSDAQVDALPTLPPGSGKPMRLGHFRVYKNRNLEPLDGMDPVVVGMHPAYQIKGRLAVKMNTFSLHKRKAENWYNDQKGSFTAFYDEFYTKKNPFDIRKFIAARRGMLPDDLEIYWLVELTFPQDKGVLRKDRFIVVTHTFVRWWESQSLRPSDQQTLASSKEDPRAFILFDYRDKRNLTVTASAREDYQSLCRNYDELIESRKRGSQQSNFHELRLVRENFRLLGKDHENLKERHVSLVGTFRKVRKAVQEAQRPGSEWGGDEHQRIQNLCEKILRLLPHE